jgi:type 2 lantibiotic biosynthesis protein LanM
MQTMLLPQPMYVAETDEVIDMSAFGAMTGQSFPLGKKLTWQAPGTDEMRLVSERVMPTMVVRSRPQLAGRDVDASEYHPEFLAGFRAAYRLFEARRDELLSAGSMLERFAQDEVRHVARATASYAALLERCIQPNQLRGVAERHRVLERLWLGVEEQPHLRALVPAEQRDLVRGDVPLFTSRPDSTDLWSSDDACIPGVFQRSAMSLVHEGLRRMGDADLALQERIIRTAIASSADGHEPDNLHIAPSKRDATEPHGALDAARSIGDRLCREALQSAASASWIGATALGPDGRAAIQPLDVSLYGGLAGCALFLAHLSAITGDPSYERVSRKALSLVCKHLERGVAVNGVGGFTGLGGIIYTLCQLSALWHDAALLDVAHGLAQKLPALLAADRTLDVIGGAAGAIAALEVLNGLRPSDELLQVAVRCGEHLLQRQAEGGGWSTDTPASQPLTGFSHGAAGIAWALIKLAAWSGQARFRHSAEAAIAYERSVFLADHANWPDFRTLGTGGRANVRCELAWCHGAPGIGLARIDSLADCDDGETRREIRIALEQTQASPFGRHACLCHGDLGNLDILLHASEQLHDSSWADIGKRLAREAVNAIAERQAASTAPMQLTNPGLMVGLAGIGYGLLRLADPKRVPSVLVLAPPSSP